MNWTDEDKCPQCGGPLPAVESIVINEDLPDDEDELGFCSEECMCDFCAEEDDDNAYEQLLEVVYWNLSFGIEPTPAQWAQLLPDEATAVRQAIEDERAEGV